ncbi:hypothetical protein [Agaribacter flavus]|uniref:Uncharacterized protein n=1 Tax=Agaribacter flavus TaxID=1902781 RepID=A0ABV7FW56_9ALTE
MVVKLPVSVKVGIAATLVGLYVFTLSWQLYDYWQGPLPGYQFFLAPGNLSLAVFWHPIFTEEVNLYPKLGMILIGQFVIVTAFVELFMRLKRRVLNLPR